MDALPEHVRRVHELIFDKDVAAVFPADGDPDYAALSLLGRHHWLRFSASRATDPAEVRAADFEKAMRALGWCFVGAPDISELPLPALTMLVETAMTDPVAARCSLEGVTALEPDEEIALLQRTLFATAPMSPRFKPRGVRLVAALSARFDATGDRAHLDATVDVLTDLRRNLPDDDGLLVLAGTAHMRRHLKGDRRPGDLDEATGLLRRALAGLDEDAGNRPAVVRALAACLIADGEHSGAPGERDLLIAELRGQQADPAGATDVARLSALIVGLEAGALTEDEEFADGPAAAETLARLRPLIGTADGEELTRLLDAHAAVSEVIAAGVDGVPDDELAGRFLQVADTVEAAGGPADQFRFLSLSLRGAQALAADDLDSAITLLGEAVRIAADSAEDIEDTESVAARLALALQQRYRLRGDPLDRERFTALSRDLGTEPVVLSPRFVETGVPPDLSTSSTRRTTAELDSLHAMQAAIMAHQASLHGPEIAEMTRRAFEVIIRVGFHEEGTGTERIAALDAELATMDAALAAEADPERRFAIETARLAVTSARVRLDPDPRAMDDFAAEVRTFLDANDLPEHLHASFGLVLANMEMPRVVAERARAVIGPKAADLTDRADRLKDLMTRYDLPADLRALLDPVMKGFELPADLRALLDALSADESAPISPVRIDRAIADAAKVSADASFNPGRRIGAARTTAQLAVHAERPEIAALALSEAVALLPQVAPVHVRPDLRERYFAEFTGLTGDATALALSTGREPLEALRLLESGRAVLQSRVLDTRAELTELREAAPELAAAYEDLIARLAGDDAAGGETPEWRHRAGEEHRRVIADIRALDGFETFAGPPSAAALLAAGKDGPIVALNTSRFGCDALICRPGGVARLPLDVAHHDVLAQVDAFVTATDALYAGAGFAEARRSHDRIREVLTWAHHRITGPVLDRLGLPVAAPEDRPRMWWAPGGVLGLLPLHAAGDYDLAHPVITADRAVSSYTPTIRHLLHSRDRARAGRRPRGFAAAVADGEPPLSYARIEAEALPPYFGERLHDAAAGRADVLDLLSRNELAHFACHGRNVPADPSTGCVVLGDEPLTVADVTALDLRHARLAYLSACRTAQNSIGDLADESLHLAAAFQVAGFPHVVGTMWPIGDGAALAFSRSFYAFLGADPDVSRSAHAVDAAMREARTGLETAPHLWGAWIHYGA